MILQRLQGGLAVVLSGAVLLAAGMLVILQWGNASEFSLYGKNYSILIAGGARQGGVNTAVLMILSAVGGVVVLVAARVFIRGAAALHKARKAGMQTEKPPT